MVSLREEESERGNQNDEYLKRIADATYAPAYRVFVEEFAKKATFVDAADTEFDYFFVLPGKRLHDSGYKTFVIVAENVETKEMALLKTGADHLWFKVNNGVDVNMEHHRAGVYGIWFRYINTHVKFRIKQPLFSTVEWIASGPHGIVE